MRGFLVLSLLLMPGVGLACKCARPAGVCQQVVASDFVFIGTVESVAPRLPILGSGRRVRFTVKTAYRGDLDEDKTLDVSTPFGDCGFDFQTGETYLVFARGDEKGGVVSTDSCSGTRRLSDAAADLAYLYFFKNNGDDSARLDGFAASNELHPTHSQTPVAGVTIELKSEHGSRFTETGADGKFVFDGLAAGDYSVTAYGPEFPKTTSLLAGPQHVRVDAKGCAAATLLIVKPSER